VLDGIKEINTYKGALEGREILRLQGMLQPPAISK